jgi:tripartite-type tricarboxylate transporter receptor subunit TctC
MLSAWFRNVTGTDIVIVPYRGAATVITDLIGGQVDLGFETTSVTLGHVRDGTVIGLGIAAEARSPEIPQVPTLMEAGVNDFVASSWTGIVAPAQTPRPIIERLNKEVNEAVKSETMQGRFRQVGAVADPGPPERFAAFIARERPKWISMVKLSGVQAE